MVHRWVPNHPDVRQRSHVDRVIVLLQIDDKYIPIAESAVELIPLTTAAPTNVEREDQRDGSMMTRCDGTNTNKSPADQQEKLET